jgi:cell division protein FtsI (penicillin-binding protein 3)
MYRLASRPAPGGRGRSSDIHVRLYWLAAFFVLAGLFILARFFQLQIVDHRMYRVLASDQHELQSALVARRGTIYLQDRFDQTLYPIAKDRDAWELYFVPRDMKDPSRTIQRISALTLIPAEEIQSKIKSPTSTYALISKDIPFETVERIRAERFSGVGFSKGLARLYPESSLGGQFLGFVSLDEKNERVGRYGVEGFHHALLAGKSGTLVAEKDASGGRLAIGTVELQPAENGADVVLTIDRTIQYQACAKMAEAARQFKAESASVVILDPNSGAVMAMCSFPDFDPASYGKTKEISYFNNPVTFSAYEPGSIFKPITLAAGLDADKITPRTTYDDKGEETMDGETVRNSDKVAHGIQSMTAVLEKSLNTGTIFVQRLLGKQLFEEYVKRFGFGEKTAIEIPAEGKGNISSLAKPGKIFAATGSYGQGITATTLQMAAAYAALGNGGKLYRPHLVKEVIYPDGRHEIRKPDLVREPIRPRTSRLISGMMVSVVESGHGKRAAVPGYYVAGKTGTAQIPDPHGKGYLKDLTIGSFAGYAPADNPAFVMVVRIDRPADLQFAEASAAPVFGELAKFLLTYLQVPPERPIKEIPPPKTPPSSQHSSSTTGTSTTR